MPHPAITPASCYSPLSDVRAHGPRVRVDDLSAPTEKFVARVSAFITTPTEKFVARVSAFITTSDRRPSRATGLAAAATVGLRFYSDVPTDSRRHRWRAACCQLWCPTRRDPASVVSTGEHLTALSTPATASTATHTHEKAFVRKNTCNLYGNILIYIGSKL